MQNKEIAQRIVEIMDNDKLTYQMMWKGFQFYFYRDNPPINILRAGFKDLARIAYLQSNVQVDSLRRANRIIDLTIDLQFKAWQAEYDLGNIPNDKHKGFTVIQGGLR